MNSIPKPTSMDASAGKPGAVLFPSVDGPIQIEQSCRTRSWGGLIAALRTFVCRLVDDSAFREISLGREISVIFTLNGPLIYRHNANSAVDLGSALSPDESHLKTDAPDVPNRLGRSSD